MSGCKHNNFKLNYIKYYWVVIRYQRQPEIIKTIYIYFFKRALDFRYVFLDIVFLMHYFGFVYFVYCSVLELKNTSLKWVM